MIEVKGLVKTYGAKRAVDGISFSVRKGDILGFLGPNGAGKSTTMKMITGFLRPDSGTATVGGIDVTQNPVAAREQVGYLAESAPAYPEMTVEEFLGFIAEVRGFTSKAAKKAQVDRALGEMTSDGTLDGFIQQYIRGGSATADLPAAEPLSQSILTPSPTVTPASAAACIDGLKFLLDETNGATEMGDPPKGKTGKIFTQTWKVQNTGTCTF